MKNSKLVHLMGLLGSREKKRLGEYLRSPYFNKREDAVRLAEVVLQRVIRREEAHDDASVFALVYPEEAFSASRLNNLKTYLQNRILDFLAQVEFESDPRARNRQLLSKLIAAGDTRYFPSTYKKALLALEDRDLLESDQLLERYLLGQIYDGFQKQTPNRHVHDHLQESADNLTHAYLARMYRFIIEDLDRKKIFGQGFRLDLREEVVTFVERNQESVPLAVQGYHLLYGIRTQVEAETLFREMRDFLRKNHAELPRPEVFNLYTATINVASRWLNDGKLMYLDDLYELYSELLAHDYLFVEGQIPGPHFKNFLSVALRSRKFTEARNFIDKFEDKLAPDLRKNLIPFSKGMLHFYQGEFETAESWFYQVLQEYQDLFFGINSRAYLLQIYFETGNSMGMESLAHSFRMFLDRHKSISEERRRQYINFILHLKRLANIPLRDKDRLEKLRKDILEKDFRGMGTSWLLEKLDEMEKRA